MKKIMSVYERCLFTSGHFFIQGYSIENYGKAIKGRYRSKQHYNSCHYGLGC